MIGIIAKLKVQAGKEAEFEKHAKALVEQVNTLENGCAFYELFKSNTDTEYVFMEMYADKAAIEAHGKTTYFGETMAALKPLLAAAPDVQSYARV
jgi:quinol monooxygenase YgiN